MWEEGVLERASPLVSQSKGQSDLGLIRLRVSESKQSNIGTLRLRDSQTQGQTYGKLDSGLGSLKIRQTKGQSDPGSI